ncbi:MAG: peptidase U32 family protein [Desulfobulbus sp.]|jgi:putative protease
MNPPSPASASLELLAPAGSLAAFEAALQEGADAVYAGAPGLNARALARDFTFAELAAMADAAHGQGKKFYVAMNSLMKEEEIPAALTTLLKLAEIGPDALIVQDLGLLWLARRYTPRIKLHASTLMTAQTAMAAACLQSLGCERVVLARELSLEEIRDIHAHCDVGLEIFVHGAMCFSYSGLCRFSSLHGGKSSLRGQCVQPCRRRYAWLPSGKHALSREARGGNRSDGYLFSMNDLCAVDLLAQVRAAGVISLKIEGRLRSVEYVRQTVRAYRLALQALDAPLEQRPGLMDAARRCLDASMGRKYATGFLIPGREDRLITPRLSGSTGEVVGKVLRIKAQKQGRGVALQAGVQTALQVGDRLRLYDERSGERKSFSLRRMEYRGRRINQARPGQQVDILIDDRDAVGMEAMGRGVLFRVDVRGRGASGQRSGPAKTSDRRHEPVVEEGRLAQLLAECWPEPVAGQGADARRAAAGGPEWWVKVPVLGMIGRRYPFPIHRMVVEVRPDNMEVLLQGRFRYRDLPLVWALPELIGKERLPWYREAVRRLRREGERCFQLGHISQQALFADGEVAGDGAPELYGGYACNALNSQSLGLYAEQGLRGVLFSIETDRATLAQALARHAAAGAAGQPVCRVGMYVYGRPPLFTARLDAPHFRGRRTFASSRGERYYLDRDANALYAFSHDPFSLLHASGELAELGVEYFLVDLSRCPLKKSSAEIAALYSGRGTLPPFFSGNYAGALM